MRQTDAAQLRVIQKEAKCTGLACCGGNISLKKGAAFMMLDVLKRLFAVLGDISLVFGGTTLTD